jgi:Flp pilus assembly protein TadG
MMTGTNEHQKQFVRARDGAVAVPFALMLTVLLLTSGLAIDYSRGLSARTALQNDLDAAILSAATKSADIPGIKAAAQTFIDNNWRDKYGAQGEIRVSIEKPEADTVRGTTSVRLPTSFISIAGLTHIDVDVVSEVVLTGTNLEVALVLDVTDSMAGDKIIALRTSARSLVDKAYEKPDARDHVRFALVPFADYVNVGEANRDAPWIDVPADRDTTTETCTDNYRELIGTSNCRIEPITYDRDGVPTTVDSTVCDYQYGPPESRCFTNTYVTRWYGCAASRNYPLDVRDEQWDVPVPGTMNVACGSPVMELTNDDAAINQRINDLATFGNTYIPAGLFWGLNILSPEAPFQAARGFGERVDGVPVQKVLVLMTDGANTRSPDYGAGSHSGADVALANSRSAELCSNIKDKGIKIYTVAFDVADNAVKDMLRDCASSPADFYDAEDGAELETAFAEIGANLSPLRIAR